MDKRQTLNEHFSCRAHPQDVKALAALAQRRGLSKSQVVRDLIRAASQESGHGQQNGQSGGKR